MVLICDCITNGGNLKRKVSHKAKSDATNTVRMVVNLKESHILNWTQEILNIPSTNVSIWNQLNHLYRWNIDIETNNHNYAIQ